MIKRIKAAAAALLAAAIVLTASGCGTPRKPGAKTVGIAMPAKFLERWNRDGEYLKKMFEEQGYNVELCFSDNDINQQVNDIQVLIADDVDLLIISAIDGSALFRTLEDAELKNIPVICYDRLIMNSGAVACYVSFDNHAVGVLLGEYLTDALQVGASDKVYNIEMVSGDTADNNARYFYNGSMEVIKPYLESGKIVIPSGKTTFEQTATPGWLTDTALENMQNTLASYYSDGTQLDGVLCSSDCLSVGVIQAVLSDYNGGNTPVITGQDADVAALRAIVDGTLSMTIYKDAGNEADVTVSVAKAILEGRELDASLADTFSAKSVYDNDTYNNGSKTVPSYLLTPEIITADDLDKLAETGAYKWDNEHKYLSAT